MFPEFTWIPFYRELAHVLSTWEDRQTELITFLETLHNRKWVNTTLTDIDEDGKNFLLKEIDPFTFFGMFNQHLRLEQRIAILTEIKAFFNLQSQVPGDIDGIPIFNNTNSWFFGYKKDRKPDDIKKLWRVFQLALKDDPLNDPEFEKAFDDALTVRGTNVNLTMGLFWIRPDSLISLDGTNRAYLNIDMQRQGLSGKFYIETLRQISKMGKPFILLSREAIRKGKQIKRMDQF